MYIKASKDLIEFIKKSPSVFHAVDALKTELKSEGFEELAEGKKWNIQKGSKYFVTRNHSSIIAFKVGEYLDDYSFNIVASHCDSPSFKIKDNYKIEASKKYVQLNTEKYGGMIYSTWLDRPLSVAGRIIAKNGENFETVLVNIDKNLVLIPNVAIHMNKEINSGMKYNEQVDLLPLYGICAEGKDSFMDLVSSYAGVQKDNIISTDLFLYNRTEPTVWGENDEFMSSPKLDNLQCAYATLQGFLRGSNTKSVNVYCCFDNEEVGSGTKQGAASTFLEDVLKRINDNLGKSSEEYLCALASSFLISADNAHAVHPNHPELSDPTNRVYMNEGIVIKHNANQKYTTDAVSSALFKEFCKRADVPYQNYTNRSDVAGGSTLGNIASSKVSINMVDIGLAQLSMHSSYETAGIKDTLYLIKASEEFFNSHITEKSSGVLSVTK
ncbi:putative M18 family aminopeptidase 2 [bioreactor metagenome]|uniref:Putative M18 family aminopeptidase 2 n=1 Tax=bioreactor metagenome TaxID=1076179 RepID=A0A644WMS6_9ZZZZ|nr:M18 family aminopeptidase [Sedimentibacter saalensis]MEA5094254.1 M18 family aminopeptidase [Sedimentibacter saalensis]